MHKFEKNKTIKGLLIAAAVLYTAFFIYLTVIGRKPYHGGHIQLEPFWSYRVPLEYRQIVLNILFFIPYGSLLYLCFKRKWPVVVTAFALSLTVEISQYVFRVGLCETDDIIHNTLGVIIGMYAVILIKKFLQKKRQNDGGGPAKKEYHKNVQQKRHRTI